ncbi:putative cytosine-purine permease [Kockovaella imperatae]|uniref:Putative cytosine-purine permease n=1 Tax=Kockovaella imperatae TaxID=4999 RepID=A0A1Y1UMB4_9TREE|nr:putative cytosine-purine permease [Kockovaella imperatae]ORX39149.1 putative cytosine-purine permease [Kockovaella imperatae]
MGYEDPKARDIAADGSTQQSQSHLQDKELESAYAAPSPEVEYGVSSLEDRRDEARPGKWDRLKAFLVDKGIEERGIVPRPEDERETLTAWRYLPQFTMWAAWNTNILTFSEGVLGPAYFGLDLKASILCIILFTAISCIPPAYLATNGPKTGMRQMVQARYALGYFPAVLFGLFNCLSFIGFMALTVILGGQCLSLASSSSMSWNVGIVVVAIISLLLSFIGLRALHLLSLTSFPIVLVLFIIIAAVTGHDLSYARPEWTSAFTKVTTGGVLGYGASLIGFTVSYSSLASDFTTSLPAHTPRSTLFIVIFLGYFIPIAIVQIFGAVAQLAAFSIPSWNEASLVGVPNLLFAMTGSGKAARAVMALLCLGVCANTAPTIYSCGLSGQVVIPWLVRIPRYFLAIVVSAIYLPIAIVGAHHFYTALSNFLSILAYWTAIYIPPVALEPLIFRTPVSRKTYPLEIWDQPSQLPLGIAAIISLICGIPLIAAGMSTTWWTGWIARKIPGGHGDVAWEITIIVVSIIFVVTRYLERRYIGR